MISLKDLGEFSPPSPKCFLLGTIQRLAAELTQDKTKAGGWGLMDGAWPGSFGGPGKLVLQEWEEAFRHLWLCCLAVTLGVSLSPDGKAMGRNQLWDT